MSGLSRLGAALRRLRKRVRVRRIESVRKRSGRPRFRSPRARERFFLERAGLFTPIVAVESELGLMCVSPYDRGKSRELFVHGRVDDRPFELALELAAEHGRPPWEGDRAFLDVGAHIGLSTVAAIRRHGFARTLSLEPEPANHRLLVLNTTLNAGAAHTRTERIAASDRVGTSALRISQSMHGKHALVTGPAEPSDQLVSVATATLDELLDRLALEPDQVGFVKIDTEGHEPRVLAGAGRLLDQGVPTMIEYAPYRLTDPTFGVELLETLLADHYTSFVDLRAAVDAAPRPQSIKELRALRAHYTGAERPRVTDVLVLR